jgi:pimeloyl-ACP methyl ester carboxylesterase
LMLLGKLTQSILPFIWIYTFFAYVIMPYKNHRKSRALFIREAKRISQNEFRRWYKLTDKILPLLNKIRGCQAATPVLYIMGKQDYMFLPYVKKIVKKHAASSLIILSDSGHVVNIDQPKAFNTSLLSFLLSEKE